MKIDLGLKGSVGQSAKSPSRPMGLSEALDSAKGLDFRSIAVVPANIEAVDAALLFSSGLEPLLAIHGPSGWGKSHILQVVHDRMEAFLGHPVPPVLPVEEWLNLPNAGSNPLAAIVDDVNSCLESPKQRLRLRLALERRVKGGRPTLLAFSGDGLSRRVKAALPVWRDWRIVEVGACAPQEREIILRHLVSNEGMVLADTLIALIATEIRGPACAMRGALLRLKAVHRQWTQPADVLRACGVLAPFLADNGDWDLREHVLKVVSESGTGLDPKDLAAYIFLHIATVPEKEAAAVLGVSEGVAYSSAYRVAQRTESCLETRRKIGLLVSEVVASLGTHRQ